MHDRCRILVVIDGMEVGGSQRQIQHLLAGLDKKRWEPELAYFRCDSVLVETIRQNGVPVHYLPKRHRVDLRFLVAFARLLRRGDYALIHAYSLTAELWSMLARDLSGRRPPLIASERSFSSAKPVWYWWIKRIVLGQSAVVIANSHAGASSAARRTHLPDAMFSTVNNGVDLSLPMAPGQRAAIRRALGVPETRAMGLFVGRLVAVKNLPCLIRALASMDPARRPWIALAGEGPLHSATEKFAAACAVADDVCLLGERTDVTQLMQAADFLVLPSHFEGQSNALLASMPAGCPVIASAVGGTPELIEDGRTGLLFRADDAFELATAMARLAGEPELRSRLAEAARQHVAQHHSQAALAAATSAVYERCLDGSATPATRRAAMRSRVRAPE